MCPRDPKPAKSPAAPDDSPRQDHLQRLERALDTMQVGVTITDADGRIVYVNRAEAEMHGYERAELIGKSSSLFAPPHLRADRLPRDLEGKRSWQRESVNVRRNGTSFPVEIISDVILGDSGEVQGIVSICHDISDRKTREHELAESRERYELALQGANDGLWDWNLLSDQVVFSARWKEMLGYEDRDIASDPTAWFSRVHPEDLDRLQRDLTAHLEAHTEAFRNEHRMMHADGDYRWMLSRAVAVRDAEGKATRIAGSQTDITDRKVHDPLTGLPNRALFTDRLESALRRGRRKPTRSLAVLFLDLDRFKLVNDSLGHMAGDQLLVGVAQRLESCLRPEDTVARIGGDEFTVLIEDIGQAQDAVQVAERIRTGLSEPFQISDQEVFTSASVGIAVGMAGKQTADGLLRDADTAMYRAKSRSPGSLQVFDDQMRQEAVHEQQLENDLRRAVARQEFVLQYQPIIALRGGAIHGFEALIRWQHPVRDLVLPGEFIDAAERSGLIGAIGRWVLLEACGQLTQWHEDFPRARELTMSVNLSPRQFHDQQLPAHVRDALAETGLPAECLELEIPERALIEDVEVSIEVLRELRAMGVHVAIDDFGTGYSSLGFLDRFPIDLLKIDRSFISRIDIEGRQRELVEAMIKAADKLGIAVIAEGVETSAQRERLEKLSCRFMQGFSFSAPVSPEEIRSRFLHND